MHDAAPAKSNAVFNTQLSFILHLSAPPAWQYTFNATQPRVNQHTVSSLHHRARSPPHRFLKRTPRYLINHKMTHCSTYTTPDLPPTLAARLAVCKRIHSNKYPPIKSCYPTSNIPLRLLTKHSDKRKYPQGLLVTLYTILPPFSFRRPTSQSTALELPNSLQCLTHS